nr:retrotransposon protein, putative, Ty1-copia subclass [Tanacetum cinerariifolium]
MGYEHPSTIPETESDEVIKSSVKNLLPISSEYEVTFDDEKINSDKLDPHYFNVESNLIESLLNRDNLFDSSPKFDFFLKEFSGELTHINPILPGIKEADFDLEEEIRLVENLFIESDDYDSEGDIHFLEELLVDDSIPLPENESSNFDHHNDPLFRRPPPEPPDVEVIFDFEPNSGELISAVKKNIDERIKDECFEPGGEINVFANVEDDDYFPFIFVIRIFLPYLIYSEVSPLLLSAGSEDTIFDPGEAAYILGIKIYTDRSQRLIGLRQSAYIEKILKILHMKNFKRGSILMQEKLRLSKSEGASTHTELKPMQNVPYASAEGSIMYAMRLIV